MTVKTVLNVAQMFVELHHLISPALGEWPSRSSKVTGNGTLLPFNGCFSGQTRISRFQFATTRPTISTENLRVVLDERSRLIRGQPSTRSSVSNNHTALWPDHVARPLHTFINSSRVGALFTPAREIGRPGRTL